MVVTVLIQASKVAFLSILVILSSQRVDQGHLMAHIPILKKQPGQLLLETTLAIVSGITTASVHVDDLLSSGDPQIRWSSEGKIRVDPSINIGEISIPRCVD